MKKRTGVESVWTEEAAEDYYYSAMPPQPRTCKQFGCGKQLRPTEQLYGDHCFTHSPIKTMKQEDLYMPGCIRTATGKYINVWNPDPELICIEDIAHSLAQNVRFGGHLPQPYSLGQHSLWCSYLAPEPHKLAALLHDGSEAYLRDLDPHLKGGLAEYQRLEAVYMQIIADKFGFEYPLHPIVKKVDKAMLEKEWRSIMLAENEDIPVYDWHKTKIFFLGEFKKLKSA